MFQRKMQEDNLRKQEDSVQKQEAIRRSVYGTLARVMINKARFILGCVVGVEEGRGGVTN